MARQPIVQGSNPGDDDKQRDVALRPRLLREVIGQQAVVQRLGIVLNACKKLKEPLSHILFDGPPGLGKTTFATVLPNELGTSIQITSGPALSKPGDLLPFLTNAVEGSILFIDEIHRMPRVVEEFIYPAMEDFRVDIVLGDGINARTISMPLKHFTLIGATTRSGMLSGPMRDRFKMHEHLEYYSVQELAEIVTINAKKLQTVITPEAAQEIARRSRGTPRVANARLWWARNFATSEADGHITLEMAHRALAMAEVDQGGLDKQDRRYLETLIKVFNGGPTGVEAMAATMHLPTDTLSEEVEPFLLREQLIVRSPRGRVATIKAYEHLGMSNVPHVQAQPTLFDTQAESIGEGLPVVTMNIQREFFAAILANPPRKKIEYREMSQFWISRLEGLGHGPFKLRLLNGMLPPVPEALIMVERLERNEELKEFRFHLGEVLSVKHWNRAQECPIPNSD